MLVLSRRVGESITIGHDVVVTVLGVRGKQVKIGFEAPREVEILRQEKDWGDGDKRGPNDAENPALVGSPQVI